MRKMVLILLTISIFIPSYLKKSEIIPINLDLLMGLTCGLVLVTMFVFFLWEKHWHVIYKIPEFKCAGIHWPEKTEEAYVSSPYSMPIKEVTKWLNKRNEKLVSMKQLSGNELKVLKARGVLNESCSILNYFNNFD